MGPQLKCVPLPGSQKGRGEMGGNYCNLTTVVFLNYLTKTSLRARPAFLLLSLVTVKNGDKRIEFVPRSAQIRPHAIPHQPLRSTYIDETKKGREIAVSL